MAGLNALDIDPQSQPPHREPGEVQSPDATFEAIEFLYVATAHFKPPVQSGKFNSRSLAAAVR